MNFYQTTFIKEIQLGIILLKKYANKFGEYMVDILMGDKSFPMDVKKRLAQKIKEAVF